MCDSLSKLDTILFQYLKFEPTNGFAFELIRYALSEIDTYSMFE